MDQLQNTFYIMGIIYMVLNVVILLGIGIGIFLLVRMGLDIKKRVDEKINLVQKIIQHPENYAAEIGTTVMKAGIRGVKNFFKKKFGDQP